MGKKYKISEVHTESDVEQKIVYRLLTTPAPNGLGYSDADILTKPNIKKLMIDKGVKKKLYYPDYVIVVDGLPSVIIEAKAPSEDIVEAAREARLYAAEINSSYKRNINPCSKVIVTNGVMIETYYWDEDKSNISLNIKDINPTTPSFDEFCKFASKLQISKSVFECLKLIKKGSRYFKPVYMLGGNAVINETVGQNSFGANISLEYKYLFNPDDLTDREAIVKNAYVHSKRKQSHVSPIDKLIRAAMPRSMVDAKPVGDTIRPKEIIDQLTDTSKIRNEICLLVGSVGSGKSTFTDYLRILALPEPVKKATEWVSLNLNQAPVSRESIYNWLILEITNSIRSKHTKVDFDHIDTLKKIYAKELIKVQKGRASLYTKDSEKHIDIIYEELKSLQEDNTKTLKAIIDFLYCDTHKLLVIVLDNCDKRSRDDQLLMFDVATWLKNTFSCMVFLPLRDSTYDQYYNEPPLDTVIKDLVFRIDPPLLERVVYARLNFALREISNRKDKLYYYLPNGIKVEVAREEVGVYLKCIVTSLFQDSLFRRMITGLAGRNIRKGLEIFLHFCKSGHIKEDEILKIRVSKGEYKLPPSLVSRILLKGNRKYYCDKESYVKNLFFSEAEDPLPDPFIRLSILQWLKVRFRDYGPNKTKGYHKVASMLQSLQYSGHSRKRALSEIESLTDANCITSESQSNMISENDLVSIAPSGFMHLDMFKNINYLSTIAEDTLFRENQVAKAIANNITGKGAHKFHSRQADISNSLILVEYMASYFNDYFLGNVKTLSEDKIEELVDLKPIKDYVERKAQSDNKYQEKSTYEDRYPLGTEVLVQIVSVKDYGFFVEFELSGSGLVHKSNFGSISTDYLNVCEEGDWVFAKVLEYNTEHSRFDLELVDV
jgi:hypothetical protein